MVIVVVVGLVVNERWSKVRRKIFVFA